jgi:adenine C2-methylase RlmN of 23S rRNA A2503 and tRNA A37
MKKKKKQHVVIVQLMLWIMIRQVHCYQRMKIIRTHTRAFLSKGILNSFSKILERHDVDAKFQTEQTTLESKGNDNRELYRILLSLNCVYLSLCRE